MCATLFFVISSDTKLVNKKLSQPHIIIVLYMPHEISRTSALRTHVSPHIQDYYLI